MTAQRIAKRNVWPIILAGGAGERVEPLVLRSRTDSSCSNASSRLNESDYTMLFKEPLGRDKTIQSCAQVRRQVFEPDLV
jgi:hypothetical protein